jgi:hypothetical protein
MKQAFRISVLANVLLTALVIGLGVHLSRERRPPGMVGTRSTASPLLVGIGDAVERVPTGFKSPPFHWRQIESTDYRTYIANLRGIGCPEQTLQDIITADVHALYASRLSALESAPAGPRPQLPSTQQAVRDEEAAVLLALLGPEPQPGQRPPLAPSRLAARRTLEGHIALPLVFQSTDFATQHLDGRQLQVINELREKFQQDLGSPGQNRADPAYRQRWQAAQRESDDLLMGMLGGRFVLDYESAATP